MVVHLVQRMRPRPAGPDYGQQIAATLVLWGIDTAEFQLPVDPEHVEQHVALLGSDVSEQRVEASHWLAARGVRRAAPAIAAAMKDPGTLRPCQLAHDIGFLGDDRCVDDLAQAARAGDSGDLRVCAILALGELGSPKATDALIDAYRGRGDMAGALAVEALGKIADRSTLPFLQSVAKAPRSSFERRAAATAIERTETLQLPDPVPSLIAQVERSSRQGEALDVWAVRKLVGFADPRAVPTLRQTFISAPAKSAGRIVLAAALLAHGDPGAAALEDIAAQAPKTPTAAPTIARAALSLSER